jgi:hypothetical protein
MIVELLQQAPSVESYAARVLLAMASLPILSASGCGIRSRAAAQRAIAQRFCALAVASLRATQRYEAIG